MFSASRLYIQTIPKIDIPPLKPWLGKRAGVVERRVPLHGCSPPALLLSYLPRSWDRFNRNASSTRNKIKKGHSKNVYAK